MTIRPTQSSIFSLVSQGLFSNSAKLLAAQQQAASGKRILKPSDDAVGSVRALALRKQVAAAERYLGAAQTGRETLDSAAASLSEASDLLNDARADIVQGLNGTLNDGDRRVLAGELREIRERLLALANKKSGDRYVFGGTATLQAPFQSADVLGVARVDYTGAARSGELLIGENDRIDVGLPGSEIFAKSEPFGTVFGTLTGAAAGASADQGSGYVFLAVRHDATTGTIGSGIQLVNGGASDTIMGSHTLVVDSTQGTVTLDNGTPVALPAAGDPAAADFVVADEHGAELHLDLTGYSGGSLSATVVGAGSVSLDGSTWTPIAFNETDLELTDAASGTVLHLNTTGIRRAGSELVQFGGTVNVFDALQGVADDLENGAGLDTADQLARLQMWLGEFDRNQSNVIAGTSALGAVSEHLSGVSARLDDAKLHAQSLLSNVEDADIGQVVLDMTRAEQTLQLAQQTSVRLIQNTLLNFLS